MTVIATPLAPHKFKHWIDKENNAELSTNPTYNFTVTKNLSLQAIFEETIVLPPVPKGVKWGCQSTANLTCTRQDGVTGAMNACADLNNDSDRFKYCNVSGAFERRKNASSPVRLTTATINQFNCSWHSGSGHQWTTFDNPGCTHEPYEIRWLSDCTTVPERVAVCL